jgi:hypothetical protein
MKAVCAPGEHDPVCGHSAPGSRQVLFSSASKILLAGGICAAGMKLKENRCLSQQPGDRSASNLPLFLVGERSFSRRQSRRLVSPPVLLPATPACRGWQWILAVTKLYMLNQKEYSHPVPEVRRMRTT